MTPRQLRQTAVALAVLVFLWGAVEIFSTDSDELTGDFALPSVGPADVDTVRLARPNDTLLLVKQDSMTWTVNGFDASTDAVKQLFDAVSKATVAELAAQSPASHGRMGVDSAKGKRLTFVRGGEAVDELIVGERGPGWTGAYVRRPGQDDVYLVRGELPTVADKMLEDWRDKRIVSIEPDSVTEVRVERRRGPYTLRRVEHGWQIGTAAADTGEVRRMLDQWRNLQAAGFATKEQEDSTDFRRPDRKVTILGKRGPLLELALDSAAYWWWGKKSDGKYVYRIESWRMDQLMPADSTLRQK
ncbi:MAG TPA: DUF4340 domain-containing protein [Gemmatimonadales bacterium]|nr:DUF4340 domain-containing protein [Gemmatimonadales bacterium]